MAAGHGNNADNCGYDEDERMMMMLTLMMIDPKYKPL